MYELPEVALAPVWEVVLPVVEALVAAALLSDDSVAVATAPDAVKK